MHVAYKAVLYALQFTYVNKNNPTACVFYRLDVLSEDGPNGVETCRSFQGFF